MLLGLAAAGLALGYGAFIFFLGWQYAKWCQDRGQVKPRVWQPIALFMLSAVAVLPIAGLMLRDEVDSTLVWVVSVIAWTNALASNLGYAAKFWTRGGIRPTDDEADRP